MYGKEKNIVYDCARKIYQYKKKKKIFFPPIGLQSLKSNISTVFYINEKCQPTAKIENQTWAILLIKSF